MSSCQQFCTKAKCQELSAKLLALESELANLKTDLAQHKSAPIPQAHKYNPSVNVDVGLAWNSGNQSLKVFVRVDVDSASGNDSETVKLGIGLDQFCSKEECEEILADLTQLQDYFNQHINSEAAHGLEKLKQQVNNIDQTLQQTNKFFNEHIVSESAHGLDKFKADFNQLANYFNQHINNQTEAHGIGEINALLNSLKQIVDNHIAANWQNVHGGVDLDCNLTPIINQINSLQSSLLNKINSSENNLNNQINGVKVEVDNLDSPIALLKDLNKQLLGLNKEQISLLKALGFDAELQEILKKIKTTENNLKKEVIGVKQEVDNLDSPLSQLGQKADSLINLNNQQISLLENFEIGDLTTLETLLEQVDTNVVAVKNVFDTTFSGNIPLGECLSQENQFTYNQKLLQGYSGSHFAAVLQALGFISNQIEEGHKDICKAVNPTVEVPSLEVITCETNDEGDLSFSSQSEVKTAGIWQASGTLLIDYLLPELINLLLEQTKETYKKVCELQIPESEPDCVPVISDGAILIENPGRILVLSFTLEADYPKVAKSRTVWEIQIPYAKEDYDWCTNFENIRYYKGGQFSSLYFQERKRKVTIWAENVDKAELFFEQIKPLTTATPEKRIDRVVDYQEYSPKVEVLRPRRAYLLSLNSDGSVKDKVCYAPPPKGC